MPIALSSLRLRLLTSFHLSSPLPSHSALEEVEQFDQIDTDVQLKQFLGDTRELLRQMIRVVNVQRQDLTRMEVITDLSYAFELLNGYVE
jgi:WASH complex subunit strumpellin